MQLDCFTCLRGISATMGVIILSEERKRDCVRVSCEVCETGEMALKIPVN